MGRLLKTMIADPSFSALLPILYAFASIPRVYQPHFPPSFAFPFDSLYFALKTGRKKMAIR